MWWTLSYICFGLAVGAAVTTAGVGVVEPPVAVLGPELVVADCDHDLGGVPRGRYEFTSPVANHGSRPARVVGYGFGELVNCCFGSDIDPPVVIEPGGTFRFVYRADLSDPGPFRAEMILYLEDRGRFREVRLSVRGECTTPKKPRKKADDPFADW